MRLTFIRSLVILFALPIFAHAHVLLGYYLADPIWVFGGIGSALPGTLPGEATIDPNYGFVDQALTTRAMKLVLSGHLPWWNSFEGFGTPLAGEMQSSAFFPFAPLVLLPSGNLILTIAIAVCAGIGMLLLLRRLGLDAWPALVGAILYQTCGTFAWLSGAWSYSIPWLPFLVLGIEYCRTTDLRSIRVGMLVIGASVALLISSGFIETAYFEGLAGICWAIARFFGIGRAEQSRYALGLAVGACLGLALAAPIVVAFADMLEMSFVGMHDASAAGSTLPLSTLLQKLVPYAYGPIFASAQADVSKIWRNTGGYVGLLPAVLAIGGLFGRRYRSVRVGLAIVVLLGFSAMLGGPLLNLVLLIPGVKYTAYFRYIDPAVSFAVCVLSAFAIEDVLMQKVARRIGLGLIATIGLIAFAYAAAGLKDISGPTASVDANLAGWHTFSLWELGLASGAVCLALLVLGARSRATILGVAACAEALVFLVIPTLSNPTGATFALGGVRFLHGHAGLSRVYSLGPLQPNYGSYFGVATLDYNDLPVPARTVTFIKDHLDPLADPVNFLAIPRPGLNQRDNFAQRVGAFESVGVKYVLTSANDPAPSPLARLRHRDLSMAIYELPNPSPYFSAPGCRVTALSRTSATSVCDAPSVLCRLELNAPGWMADVDGRPEQPADCGEIFEAVNVPAGTSHVTFRFVPPHETIALGVSAVAIVSFIALMLSIGIRRSAQRQTA